MPLMLKDYRGYRALVEYDAGDQIFAIASNGVVIRTRVDDVRPSGRDTMGVTLMNLVEGDAIVAVARGAESDADDDDTAEADDTAPADAAEGAAEGEAAE